jgi:hypothetical protein
MAEINVERKSGMGWLWWVLGLIVLALLIWWVIPDGEEEVAVMEPAPMVTPTTTPEPIAQGTLCVAQVLSAPTTYIGQTLGTCPMRVVEVVSDRGFWIEENGQRVFVVINEGTQQNPQPGVADAQGQQAEQPDVNAGQTVNITEAMVMDNVANVAPPLDQQTRDILSSQPWFLVTDGRNISIQ